ncbi:hypothetical protein K435DRAFT_961162 [Dendrothele bispora CBS 962.96]|uniref:G-protein coupled receptors family 1 profile domain-containing protein n=1 Tax=Dendrothele bispora (strain CBS 962.96) TaxID=1314807 RepID=A0A4S8MQR4_DENBC|nr:hypothetical protein K435DRAFT_961162 [Dendrothele bispora CBS 962.96]
MSSTNGTQPVMPNNIIQASHSELVLFLVLNMWPSHIGLPFLLAIVVFSKRVQRHATFINLLVVFMIVGISSSILAYAGKTTGPEPSKLLCLFQASLLYGMPAITSLAAFFLVFQMFIVIRSAFYGRVYMERDHNMRRWLMICTPYVAWMVSMLVTAVVGAARPQYISRNRRFFYCSVKNDSLTNVIVIVAAAIILATLVLEVWTVVLFYKRWLSSQKGNHHMLSTLELNLPIRILSFGLYLAIALSMSLLSISSPQSPIPDLIIASAATVVILIFGTQPDILGVLCFWKTQAPQPPPKDEAISVRPSLEEKGHQSLHPGPAMNVQYEP